jgi:hypothetical protein
LKTITLRFQNTFIRAENDEGCYGTGHNSRTHSKIETSEERILCDGSGLSIILESGILFPALTADAYAWSTGETTHSIEVSKEGDYTVVVTNEAGCSETRTCNVTLSYLAKNKI